MEANMKPDSNNIELPKFFENMEDFDDITV